ncbi:MAG: succinate dehydrogenase, cytochrome b556 subunit [Pseudomonadota bacterium]
MAQGALSDKPLSPHLQIWRFTVTMAASITHRGTGVVLYGGTALLAGWLLAIGMNAPIYSAIAGFVNSPIGFIVIAGYIWSLCFHLFNGLRHLYWDAGRGFAVGMAKMTAWLVYLAATILAIIIIWAGMISKGVS